jgi:hypothetical protein
MEHTAVDAPPQWLTAQQAQQQFGISFVTLHQWRRHGCPSLGGRPPRVSRTKARAPGAKKPSYLFDRADLEAAAAPRPWDDTWHDASGDWISTKLAAARFGLTSWALDGCRLRGSLALGGKKLRSQMVSIIEAVRGRSPRCRRRRVFHSEDLVAIAAGDVALDPQWLPQAAVAERYGFSIGMLHIWRRRGCPFLGGAKLRSRMVRACVSRRECLLRAYSRADVEEIRRVRKTDPAATFDPEWLTYREAKALFGFSQPRLSCWNLSGCRHLPQGRRLAARKILTGVGGRMMRVTRYSRADLEEIARASGGALPRPARDSRARESPPVRRRRGRAYDPDTAALYQFCYEQLAGRECKRSEICVLAGQRFPGYELHESDVTTYARRHATRERRPWPV